MNDQTKEEILDEILKWMNDNDPFGKITIEKGSDGNLKRFTIHQEKTKKFTYKIDEKISVEKVLQKGV